MSPAPHDVAEDSTSGLLPAYGDPALTAGGGAGVLLSPRYHEFKHKRIRWLYVEDKDNEFTFEVETVDHPTCPGTLSIQYSAIVRSEESYVFKRPVYWAEPGVPKLESEEAMKRRLADPRTVHLIRLTANIYIKKTVRTWDKYTLTYPKRPDCPPSTSWVEPSEGGPYSTLRYHKQVSIEEEYQYSGLYTGVRERFGGLPGIIGAKKLLLARLAEMFPGIKGETIVEDEDRFGGR